MNRRNARSRAAEEWARPVRVEGSIHEPKMALRVFERENAVTACVLEAAASQKVVAKNTLITGPPVCRRT